jgi:hypothetical protein
MKDDLMHEIRKLEWKRYEHLVRSERNSQLVVAVANLLVIAGVVFAVTRQK